MAAADLKRLMVNHRAMALLSDQEAEILRRFARGQSARGVANLYGGSEAWALRKLEEIRAKLEGKPSVAPASVNGDGAGAAAAPSSASSQPASAPSPVASTQRKVSPAWAPHVVGFLRERGGSASIPEIAKAIGMPKGTTDSVFGRMLQRGELVVVGEEPAPRGGPARRLVALPVEPAIKTTGLPTPALIPRGIVPGPMMGGPDPRPVFEAVEDEQEREAEVAAPAVDPLKVMQAVAGARADVVRPPDRLIVLWDLLLREGADWPADHVGRYLESCRRFYARFGDL